MYCIVHFCFRIVYSDEAEYDHSNSGEDISEEGKAIEKPIFGVQEKAGEDESLLGDETGMEVECDK